MTQALAHRGPDGSGEWTSKNGRLSLGHTRLSVIDLAGGAQPMLSRDGRFVVVFNGEIYNYRDVRRELTDRGVALRTQSDTEALLEGFGLWGLAVLERVRGMFAFAIFDERTEQLTLARDRLGMKPLFYHHDVHSFAFGSEVKSLLTLEDLPRLIDHEALADFLALGYALPSRTAFRGIRELEPGTSLTVSTRSVRRAPYWRWRRRPQARSLDDALDMTSDALRESVREHLVSDVPVAAALSGGIDSALIASVAVRELGQSLSTFTVGMDDARYDESEHASTVADALGVEHTTLRLRDGSASLATIERVIRHFDQPFGDTSALPTYLISREMRKHVKVVLAGDGGDEMFGGYPRFRWAQYARLAAFIAPELLEAMGTFASAFARVSPDRTREARRFLGVARKRGGERLLALAALVDPSEVLQILQPEIVALLDGYAPELSPKPRTPEPGWEELVDATISIPLPADYLRKVDMMSSAHGLEVRVPFLGDRVVDCAARLPARMRHSYVRTKPLLRKLAERHLSPAHVRRPKKGFGVPLDTWLSTDDRRHVADRLIASSARIASLIRPDYTADVAAAFVRGTWDRARWSRYGVYQRFFSLWSLETWLDQWHPGA